MTEAYILEAIRTPRGKGKASGALHELRPVTLVSAVLNELQHRCLADTAVVNDLLLGCVTPIFEQGGDLAKTALLYAGWSQSVPGMVLNRYCSSGLDALLIAASRIRSGWDNLIVSGGVESMSRVPMNSDLAPHINDPDIISKTGYIPQGVAADLIATLHHVSRQELDAYALRSHQRAVTAQQQGWFDRSLVAIKDISGLPILDYDQCPRKTANAEALAALPTAFEADGAAGFDAIAAQKYPQIERIAHIHTAGNSSALADGAAAILVGSMEQSRSLGIRPRARLRSFGTASTEPTIMLMGVGPAIQAALEKAGIRANDVDIWEINEAFAVIPLVVQRQFDIPDDKLNTTGGAIALGHPLGATGAMLVGQALDELERRNLNIAVVALCVGGGMGVAVVLERVN